LSVVDKSNGSSKRGSSRLSNWAILINLNQKKSATEYGKGVRVISNARGKSTNTTIGVKSMAMGRELMEGMSKGLRKLEVSK